MRNRVQAEGGRHADPRDPAEVLGAQSRRRGADVPRWRARSMAEGMHGVGVVRARAALADGGARHAGHPRGAALPHRHPRRGEAGLLPPLPRVQGLRAHAGDGGRLRGRVHAQRDAQRPRDGGGRVRQHGIRLGRPRAAPRDVRGVRDRQARVPPHSLVDPGLALPAHGRRGRGGRVRAVGGRGRGALLQPQPPRRPRRPAAMGRGRPGAPLRRVRGLRPRALGLRAARAVPRVRRLPAARGVRGVPAVLRRRGEGCGDRRRDARLAFRRSAPRAPRRRVHYPPPAPPPGRGARPGAPRAPRRRRADTPGSACASRGAA